jgi:hypothetical protein
MIQLSPRNSMMWKPPTEDSSTMSPVPVSSGRTARSSDSDAVTIVPTVGMLARSTMRP